MGIKLHAQLLQLVTFKDNLALTKNLFHFYIVKCQGVVQLGVPAPMFVGGGPPKVEACTSFLHTESSLVFKIKKT